MRRPSWPALWPILFVLLAVVFFLPALASIDGVVVGSADTPFTDGATQYYPLKHFVNGELRQWRLPLWNPYILCGYPLVGEGQLGVFYPLNLLFSPLSAPLALNLFALVHFAAAGIFFCLYLRACGLERFTAFFGGFVYMFSSAPISRLFAGHFCVLPFLALAPALLWAWQSWRQDGRWTKAVWGGVFLGGMVLSGYPQLLLYVSLYLGWHVLAETISRGRRQAEGGALEPLRFFLAVELLGAGFGAIQLLPSYAFLRESFRLEATYETIASFSFPPENLLTLLLPRFFGNMGAGTAPYWGRNLLWESWIYIGVVPLALALMALLRVRTRAVAVHGTAAAVFLALALGKHTPLHRILYDTIPSFSFFRGSSKASFCVLFSLGALAAIGLERLLNEREPAKQRADRIALAAILGAFALLGVLLGALFGPRHAAADAALSRFVHWTLSRGEIFLPHYFSNPPDLALIWKQAFPQLALLVSLSLFGLLVVAAWPALTRSRPLSRAALCLAVFPELLHFSAAEFVTAPVDTYAVSPDLLRELRRDPARTRVLAPDYSRNAFLPYRVASPLGNVGIATRRYNNFLTAANGVARSSSMSETPLLRLSPELLWPSVTHLLVGEEVRPPESVATPFARRAGETLYRLRETHPRAAFAQAVAAYHSSEAALADLESGATDLSAADILEIPPGLAEPAFGPPSPGDAAEIVEALPARVAVHTRAAGARLLVLADAFASGWRCRTEDGARLDIYPVNVAFRGVVVPPGEHAVTFSYEPPAFAFGAGISALSLVAALGAGVAARRRVPSGVDETRPGGGRASA